MRTYSKSLAIANRILGSESSKIYYSSTSNGAVHQGLVFGVVKSLPAQSILLTSITLDLQEASDTDITCTLVKVTDPNLSITVSEQDTSAVDITVTLSAGDRHVSQEISPHILSGSYVYGLKVTACRADPSTGDPGEGLSTTYVLGYV
jgi:hypothetical protein